jgi:Cu(I)/Ag(I) efflux system membrane protein CusA/SilA
MTVSTVVAGLLPIMWSTRVGAEVMKPLATPVLGGMLSSLVHVLIVTPVIFFSIRRAATWPDRQCGAPTDRVAPLTAGAVIVAVIGAGGWFAWRTLRARAAPTSGIAPRPIATTRAGTSTSC